MGGCHKCSVSYAVEDGIKRPRSPGKGIFWLELQTRNNLR
jgi:hypothetical protein